MLRLSSYSIAIMESRLTLLGTSFVWVHMLTSQLELALQWDCCSQTIEG
jgi:hypothetical protein